MSGNTACSSEAEILNIHVGNLSRNAVCVRYRHGNIYTVALYNDPRQTGSQKEPQNNDKIIVIRE